ncbi:MAG: HAMP domain-containing protein [Bacteroidales bacterium]|nr:HAMP domain-containing protein [Bacteroidales bacterium]
MKFLTKSSKSNFTEKLLLKPYIKFTSSIYGRVVYIILGTSIFLFLSFSIIFRSVNEQYLNTVIRQNGNNIGSIVRGSLYQSMLENDKSTLQNTLDIINTMPGIDEVNMYDTQNNLVYSSIPPVAAESHANPNCITCHNDFQEMFPGDETHYRVLNIDSDCKMNTNGNDYRLLLIKVPILNEESCYKSSCHAHKPTDNVLGSLIIKIPLEELDMAEKKSSAEFFVLATITTTFLIIVLIVFTRRRIKDPLNDLVKASTAVANGDKTMRLEINPNQLEDMKMVSRAFNEMLDNLQSATDELENWSQQLEYKVQKKSEELSAAQNELIHIERLASLGKLSSSVAHEINNPLSGILIYAKLIYKQLSNPELFTVKRESVLKHLQLIENEAKRCGDIVKGLLEFSRKDQEDIEPRHLHDILRETYELMTHPIKIANIHFYTDFTATNDLINCSPNQIKQACVAMLVNASEAVMENGEIIIRTLNPDPETIRLEIIDNGIGISPGDIPHIFEPFFSTKQSASGIGLGLAIVHGIIQSHKSEIQVKSEPGKGSTFAITIPLIRN